MPITAQSPDGVLHQFPDGTPDTVVDRAMQDYIKAPATNDNGGILKNLAAGALSLPGSLADTLSAPTSDMGGGMADTIATTRDTALQHSNVTFDAPIGKAIGKVTGVDPSKVTANTFPERLARGVGAGLTGALIPGAEGYTVGQMLTNAAMGAVSGAGAATGAEVAPDRFKPLGAAVGGIAAPLAAGALVGAVQSGREAIAAGKTEIPTIVDLNTAKKAAYAKVDNSGMTIAQPAVQSLYEGAKGALEKMGLNENTIGNLAPKTSTALDSLERAATGDQSLQDMEVQRRIAGIAAGSIDKTDRAAARIIQDHIDNFIGGLKPEQLSGPVDQDAIDALPQARDLAKRSFKAQTIQDLIDKAGNNASGFGQSGLENSIRVQFRKLMNNTRGMARFSPDEQDSIRRVATGGNAFSANNLLRDVGKLSPQGALPLLGEVGLVASTGPGALAVPAAGLAGRAAATSMTKAAAQRALNMALSGKGAAANNGTSIGQILHAAAKGALNSSDKTVGMVIGNQISNDSALQKVQP